MHPKSATFKSRHRSSRGTSTLYKRLRVSNHFHNLFLTSNENLTPTSYTFSEFLSANFRKNRKQKSDFEFNAKSRTTAENIAYRTNQLPVGAQVFAATACNPTISKILLLLVNFTERKRIKSRTRFSAKSTQNLKICMRSTHSLIVFFNILAPF